MGLAGNFKKRGVLNTGVKQEVSDAEISKTVNEVCNLDSTRQLVSANGVQSSCIRRYSLVTSFL